jgi:hypothetical protein
MLSEVAFNSALHTLGGDATCDDEALVGSYPTPHLMLVSNRLVGTLCQVVWEGGQPWPHLRYATGWLVSSDTNGVRVRVVST